MYYSCTEKYIGHLDGFNTLRAAAKISKKQRFTKIHVEAARVSFLQNEFSKHLAWPPLRLLELDPEYRPLEGACRPQKGLPPSKLRSKNTLRFLQWKTFSRWCFGTGHVWQSANTDVSCSIGFYHGSPLVFFRPFFNDTKPFPLTVLPPHSY